MQYGDNNLQCNVVTIYIANFCDNKMQHNVETDSGAQCSSGRVLDLTSLGSVVISARQWFNVGKCPDITESMSKARFTGKKIQI